jgi:DNA repair exonuclease SbcCD ATPase subunit
MFKINTLTVKNFMSVGNQTQAVDFDRKDLTLVLGANLDQGGDDSGARNGTGKTTIINALSYALYGQALTKIRVDNLINKTNAKAMLVTIDFEVHGISYRLERGRKPNVLKYFVANQEQERSEEQQGDSRETQKEIDKLLGMSHEMFKHLVALNTYTQPFLSLGDKDQRAIIEQLLGITLLSEKSESLKDMIRQTRELIKEEEFRIKAVEDANKRILDQIESTKKRQRLWQAKRKEDVTKFKQGIDDLSHVDIDQEIKNHSLLEQYYKKQKTIQDTERWTQGLDKDNTKQEKSITRLDQEIKLLNEHKCYACGQDVHNDKQAIIVQNKTEQRDEALNIMVANGEQLNAYNLIIEEVGEIGSAPRVFYDTLDKAYNHRQSLDALVKELEQRTDSINPYDEQIEDMTNTGVEDVSWNNINDLTNMQDHQEFLLKLLTNKDSFIRKRIIDQNLTFLNTRLTYYLACMGLPHSVKFMNDLSVEIQELGRDLDFDNLSRGERNRLILSLSWAFRDVWESLYHPINLLFIDEVVDSGMDSSGVESALAVLKKMSRERNKSIWLVSHKDELAGRVNNLLKVVKENGYTSYDTDVEIV